jgi:acetyl esterase/lipase
MDISNGFEAPLAALRGLQSSWPMPPAILEVTEETTTYTTRDGTSLDLFVFHRVTSTESDKGAKPVVIYFHGGGGVVGTAYSVAPLARDLVLDHDVVVISPQYRLAPENPFPTGTNDAWDAFAYIAANASSINAEIDLTRGLVVGGASQGAVHTSLIALRAKDETLPAITGLFFGAGAFVASPDTIPAKYRQQLVSPTNDKCMSAPVYNTETKALFDAAYGADTASPAYRAFNVHPLEEKHKGLARRAYFQVCGADMLRDHSLIYADVLKDLNGEEMDVRVDVYKGAPHVFWTIFVMTKLFAKWKEDTKAGVSWLLGRGEAVKL